MVKPVGPNDLVQARVGSRVLLVAVRLLVLKVVGAQKIILRARAIDGREIAVAVEEKLDFALAPPIVAVDALSQVSAHVLPSSLHIIQNRVGYLVSRRVLAPKLGVEVRGICWHLS